MNGRLASLLSVWFIASIVVFGQSAPEENQRLLSFFTSILPNGDFEDSIADKPAYWDRPDGLGVKWLCCVGDDSRPKHDMIIALDTRVSEKQMVDRWKQQKIKEWNIPNPSNNPIAASYGLSYYSAPIPVKKGQAYRVWFDYQGQSQGGKLWIRGYGVLAGKKRRLYETIVYCRAKSTDWQEFAQVFHPTRYRDQVTEIRVMLYAYWPPAVYHFDNVRIVPISAEAYQQARQKN